MATRATYRIEGMTFYCHWDGYPAGAAARFAKMIAAHTKPTDRGHDTIARVRGGFAFSFIRGNNDAEPTDSHTAHGDTEYKYDLEVKRVDGRSLLYVSAMSRMPGNEHWKVHSHSELAEWIKAQRADHIHCVWNYFRTQEHTEETEESVRQWCYDWIPEIVRCDIDETCGQRSHYATLADAVKIKTRESHVASEFKQDNPNKAHHLNRMRAWRRAIEQHTGEAQKAA